MAKKAELEVVFAASPYKKYKVVMAQARAELGIDEEYYDDANAAKKYFKEFVPLQKYTMGKHMGLIVLRYFSDFRCRTFRKIVCEKCEKID